MPAEQTSTKPSMFNKNVAGGPLALFDKGRGFFKDGYCRTESSDSGNHSVAATISSDFLDFTGSKGNDLKAVGAQPGAKWCLCASRWQEAFKAYQDGLLKKEAVPQVHLHATHDKVLDSGVTYKDLKQFAAAGEATKQSGRQDTHFDPASGGNSVAKNSQELGDHDLSLAPGKGSHAKTGTVTDTSASRG